MRSVWSLGFSECSAVADLAFVFRYSVSAQDRAEAGREYRRTGVHDGNLVVYSLFELR